MNKSDRHKGLQEVSLYDVHSSLECSQDLTNCQWASATNHDVIWKICKLNICLMETTVWTITCRSSDRNHKTYLVSRITGDTKEANKGTVALKEVFPKSKTRNIVYNIEIEDIFQLIYKQIQVIFALIAIQHCRNMVNLNFVFFLQISKWRMGSNLPFLSLMRLSSIPLQRDSGLNSMLPSFRTAATSSSTDCISSSMNPTICMAFCGWRKKEIKVKSGICNDLVHLYIVPLLHVPIKMA